MYPALAVLQALKQRATDTQILWVGGEKGMEAELVARAGLPYEAIPAAGVHGVGLRALPGNLLALGRGFAAARGVLERFQPEVVFFTGGYIAGPVALAARMLGKRRPRLVVFTPDIEPGLALKLLARIADRIAIPAEAARAYYAESAPLKVTGYPVRSDLTTWSKAQALGVFNLEATQPVVLVFGGSKGARSINRALLAALPEILPLAQVVHVSGELDWQEVAHARQALTEAEQARYRAYPYLHNEMGAAFRCADLVIARAGASSLGEFPRFGLPAILVPYPHAWRYQQVNAEYLARQGAAVVLPDGELPQRLAAEVCGLLGASERLAAMRQAMQQLDQPQAALEIARLFDEVQPG